MPDSPITPLDGIELPPQTQLDLICMRAANAAVLQHMRLCPFSSLQIEQRLRNMENRFYLLIGYMVGSGLIGGAAGALLVKHLWT